MVVIEHPVVCNDWSHTKHSFSLSLENLMVAKLISIVFFRYKFVIDNSPTVKKSDEHVFDF